MQKRNIIIHRIQISQAKAASFEEGYPLLTEEDFGTLIEKNMEEGDLLDLYVGNSFVARAYYGLQNKGLGWVLTLDPSEEINGEFFTKRFKCALEKRAVFFSLEDTNCFRIFHAEGDGIGGLQIDFYADYCLIHWYSKGIYAFRQIILESLIAQVDVLGVYEKRRFKNKGQYMEGDDFVMGQPHPHDFFVREHGIKYKVDLDQGAMTGLFLDQRDVRGRLLNDYAKGRRLLNCFAYSGAFSVSGKKGGALSTVSVDLANRSQQMIEENFRLNGMDPKLETVVIDDVYDYLNFARKKAFRFDLVVVDPPSFSRSKKRIFRAEKDYGGLVSLLAPLLEKDAILVCSTNASNMGMKAFRKFVTDALAGQKRSYRLLHSFENPKDFPSISVYPPSNYLKVLFFEIA